MASFQQHAVAALADLTDGDSRSSVPEHAPGPAPAAMTTTGCSEPLLANDLYLWGPPLPQYTVPIAEPHPLRPYEAAAFLPQHTQDSHATAMCRSSGSIGGGGGYQHEEIPRYDFPSFDPAGHFHSRLHWQGAGSVSTDMLTHGTYDPASSVPWSVGGSHAWSRRESAYQVPSDRSSPETLLSPTSSYTSSGFFGSVPSLPRASIPQAGPSLGGSPEPHEVLEDEPAGVASNSNSSSPVVPKNGITTRTARSKSLGTLSDRAADSRRPVIVKARKPIVTKTSRRQNVACDGCRASKKACDLPTMMDLDEIGVQTEAPVSCSFCLKKGRPCTTQDVHEIKIAKKWLEYSPMASPELGRRLSEQGESSTRSSSISSQIVLPPRSASFSKAVASSRGTADSSLEAKKSDEERAIAAHKAAWDAWLDGWLLRDFDATPLLHSIAAERAWLDWTASWRQWSRADVLPPKVWQAAVALDVVLSREKKTFAHGDIYPAIQKAMIAHGAQYLDPAITDEPVKARHWHDAEDALSRSDLFPCVSLALALIVFSGAPPPFAFVPCNHGARTRASQIAEQKAVEAVQAQQVAHAAGVTGVKMLLEALQAARVALAGSSVLAVLLDNLFAFAFAIDGVFVVLRRGHPIFDTDEQSHGDGGGGSSPGEVDSTHALLLLQHSTVAPPESELLPYVWRAVALNASLQHRLATARGSKNVEGATAEARLYRDSLHRVLLLGLQGLASLSSASQRALVLAMLDVCLSIFALVDLRTHPLDEEMSEMRSLATLTLLSLFDDAALPHLLKHPVPAMVLSAAQQCCASALDMVAGPAPATIGLEDIRPNLQRIFALLADLRTTMPHFASHDFDRRHSALAARYAALPLSR